MRAFSAPPLLALVLASAAARVVLTGAAQDPAQTARRPVFRGGVEFVRVDVVVTDDKDRPVTDLTIADFEIVEKGRPQTITDFLYVDVPVAKREIGDDVPVAPPPDVATNELPSEASRAFVMLVDDRHLLTHDIVPVKRVMTDFLRALGPDDQVAIAFVGRSDLGTDFTNDLGRLLESVDGVREVFGFGLDSLPPRPGQGAFHEARSTLDTLRNVVATLAASRHMRRAVVYVSAGINHDPGASPGTLEGIEYLNLHQDLQRIYREAGRVDVPVYTLDPRGLATPELAVRSPFALVNPDVVREVSRRIRIQQDHMAEVAVNTGGRAFIKQSDLTGAVNQIVAENGSFYLLGYYPTPYTPDGEFHAIDVRVKRPGVRVRPRKGYIAPKPADTSAEPGASLAATLGEGLPNGGLRLDAVATPLAAGEQGRVTTAISVRVRYEPDEARTGVPDEALLMGVLALDTDAHVRVSSDQRLAFDLPAGADAFQIDYVLDLPRGQSALRVGVASRVTGRTGTVHLPIDLPDLGDGKLALSGLVLARAGETRPPSVGSAELPALLPFAPTVDRTFAREDVLRVFARVFPPKQGGDRVQAALTMDGAANLGLQVACAASTRVAGTMDCQAEAPLSGLAPGTHVLTFAARVGGDGKPVTRSIPIEIK
jgi:VWFA-related protein